jgi:hypothetical protein
MAAAAAGHPEFMRSHQLRHPGRLMPGPASRVQAHFVHDASGELIMFAYRQNLPYPLVYKSFYRLVV